jgi:hypothetical protein
MPNGTVRFTACAAGVCAVEQRRQHARHTFEQIRHYAGNDGAVSLRPLRALGDILPVRCIRTEPAPNLLERARRMIERCGERLGEAEAAQLRLRLAFAVRFLAG